MPMVSMKTDRDMRISPMSDNPYGYGLTICLNEEQVEALGLNTNPPKPGSTVGVRAIALVRRVTQEADVGDAEEKGEGSDIDVVLELQITDMEVTPGAQPAQSATALYG